jgi:hypothetical protein
MYRLLQRCRSQTTCSIASVMNIFVLRCYSPHFALRGKYITMMYTWHPCLTFFNDHCYFQNKVSTPWSRIYMLYGLTILLAALCCPNLLCTLLLLGTNYPQSFMFPYVFVHLQRHILKHPPLLWPSGRFPLNFHDSVQTSLWAFFPDA